MIKILFYQLACRFCCCRTMPRVLHRWCRVTTGLFKIRDLLAFTHRAQSQKGIRVDRKARSPDTRLSSRVRLKIRRFRADFCCVRTFAHTLTERDACVVTNAPFLRHRTIRSLKKKKKTEKRKISGFVLWKSGEKGGGESKAFTHDPVFSLAGAKVMSASLTLARGTECFLYDSLVERHNIDVSYYGWWASMITSTIVKKKKTHLTCTCIFFVFFCQPVYAFNRYACVVL